MFSPRPFLLIGALAVLVAGCDSATDTAPTPLASAKAATEDPNELISAQMDAVNAVLASEGADYRVAIAEWIAGPGSDEAGNTIVQKDVGNKQLTADFVPGDERRTWSANGGNSLTYAIDETLDAVPFGGGLTGAQTDAAIMSAMSTWDGVTCSALNLTRNSAGSVDLGFIAASNGLGGSFAVAGDVQHAGFRDLDFAGGVLGVAFTLIFTEGGVATDIDGNGKADVAFREIYYDPSWVWSLDGLLGTVDVESIALHEAGHGLSQAHFGNISIRNNGSFKASPRAVMNAFYSGGSQTELLGTDNGGHCSNWAQWPNN